MKYDGTMKQMLEHWKGGFKLTNDKLKFKPSTDRIKYAKNT